MRTIHTCLLTGCLLAVNATADDEFKRWMETQRAGTSSAERSTPPSSKKQVTDWRQEFERGHDLGFGKGRWAEAIAVYAAVAEAAPDQAVVFNVLGIALVNGNRSAEALPAFRRSVQLDRKWNLDPGGGFDNLRFGSLWSMQRLASARKYEEAAGFARFALDLLPDDIELRREAFTALIAAGQFAPAETAARSAVERHVVAGARKVAAGDFVGAEESFGLAVETASASSDLEAWIGKIYLARIKGLDYRGQMNSPEHELAVRHFRRETTKYFQQNPFVQSTAFRPPLDGAFCVYQEPGGASYHYAESHFAWDLGRCSADSSGQPVVAAADGVVVAVESAHPDRPAGSPVDLTAPANLVRIDHGGLIGHYVHLQQYSSRLKAGDRVAAGTVIGRVGNSGTSTGPHLHFQVNDAKGRSVPVRFGGLTRLTPAPARPTGEMNAIGMYRAGAE